MTLAYHRPRDAAEALALLAATEGRGSDRPSAMRLPLAGGTQLNSAESRNLDFEAVDLSALLPRGVSRSEGGIAIGAGTSFQELVDSPETPSALRAAAAGMRDRNIRNRATIGGNLGADKACSSLVPVLLAFDADLLLLDGRRLSLEKWLDLPPGPAGRNVITSLNIAIDNKIRVAYARWSRVAADLAILGAAAAYRIEGDRIRGLRLVLGGVSAHARRHGTLEAAFEGSPLPPRADIEALVSGLDGHGRPFVSPRDDARGSAVFKRSRISSLVAEVLLGALAADGTQSTEARR
ncbi:MAG TPA: FAD binding domain-containing protein [Rectinemataceae bacterium]|nr:FAD binding domain-containing protein [Rectinemataceae bacterium]